MGIITKVSIKYFSNFLTQWHRRAIVCVLVISVTCIQCKSNPEGDTLVAEDIDLTGKLADLWDTINNELIYYTPRISDEAIPIIYQRNFPKLHTEHANVSPITTVASRGNLLTSGTELTTISPGLSQQYISTDDLDLTTQTTPITATAPYAPLQKIGIIALGVTIGVWSLAVVCAGFLYRFFPGPPAFTIVSTPPPLS